MRTLAVFSKVFEVPFFLLLFAKFMGLNTYNNSDFSLKRKSFFFFLRYDMILKMNLKQKDMLQQISDSIITMNEVIGSNPLDPVISIILKL